MFFRDAQKQFREKREQQDRERYVRFVTSMIWNSCCQWSLYRNSEKRPTRQRAAMSAAREKCGSTGHKVRFSDQVESLDDVTQDRE